MIRQKGFHGAITVRPCKDGYKIVDGLHRFTAARDAGLTEINVDIVDLNDDEVLEAQIMISTHKIETKPIEYANQLKRLLARNPVMTMDELASKLGKSPIWLSCQLSLNKIKSKWVKRLIDDGAIKLVNAYALAMLPADEQTHWTQSAISMETTDFVALVNARRQELCRAKIFLEQDQRTAKTPKKIVPSAYELLYGQPVPHDEELTPLSRPGWDHVTGKGKAAFAYCYGDILVLYSGRCWAIDDPNMQELGNLSFRLVTDAQEFVERINKPG